jgi:hypothetical protein
MMTSVCCSTESYHVPAVHSSPTSSNVISITTILERLHNRDSDMFKQIIDAVKTNDVSRSLMIASELAQIRILERNLCVILDLSIMQNK